MNEITLVAALLVLPYAYVLVRVASRAYFEQKLNFHKQLVSTMTQGAENG